MKTLRLACLGAALAAAVPSLAAPRRCANGLPPQLSGDAFSPVECSTAAKSAVALPASPVAPSTAPIAGLSGLDGQWEGSLIHAFGRYDLILTIKTSWNGKIELVLDAKELQFRERLTDRLTLSPSKPRGAYEAVLTSSAAPEASLKGRAMIVAAAAESQADIMFANGAAHRIFFSIKDGAQLRVRAFSAIPGAPLQTFETVFTRK